MTEEPAPSIIGRELSHYKILDRLGAGGMGEVYLAEDTELGRRVALKLLPKQVSGDADRLERFRRESRAAAAINHPGIVTLYGIEEDDGVHFLTMELVEGETLDRIVPKGGLAIARFFEIAVPLAEAIRAAHQNGVVHRDLKPGNVMLNAEGQVKVLDFGLAKVDGPAPEASISAAPTEALLTRTGQIMGTPYYMSPEQVEGKPADQRSDLFSLGVILYLMATGRRPFEGESAVAIMSAILQNEPTDVCELRPDLPRALGRIIRHCLAKSPERRFQTALDLRNELEQLAGELSAPAPVTTPVGSGARRARLWIGLAALAVIALVAWAYLGRGEPPPAERSLTDVQPAQTLRPLTFSAAVDEYPAFSADGRRLAFCREVDGYLKIFVLDLDTGVERQLTDGLVDDIQPAFSPDGATLVFVRSNHEGGKVQLSDRYAMHSFGDIWRLEIESGKLSKIVNEGFAPAFAPDGQHLAFYSALSGPRRIWVADAFGRNPRQVTSDATEQVAHLLPRWSPDGTRIVFQNNYWTTKFDIKVVDVATGEMRWVTDDNYTDVNPVWSPDGSIYFSSYRSGGMNIWRVPVQADGTPAGPLQQMTTGAGNDVQLAVSPTGNVLAFSVSSRNADIWRLPVDPATGRPVGEPEPLIVTTREESRGAWSPDGAIVAFNSDRDGHMNLWLLTLADGSTRQLTEGPGGDYQANWSPDGSTIAFFSMRSGDADIWTVDVASGELTQLTDDPAVDINPFHSPDGEWIVFQSDRGGRREAWIMLSDGSDQRQLTFNTFGGTHYFAWTADSSHAIVRGAEGGAWKVPVEGGEPQRYSDGGWHITLSPDRSLILDNNHGAIFVGETHPEAEMEKVFEFEDPSITLDYTVWSPDGRWVLFDRLESQASDIWMLELGG